MSHHGRTIATVDENDPDLMEDEEERLDEEEEANVEAVLVGGGDGAAAMLSIAKSTGQAVDAGQSAAAAAESSAWSTAVEGVLEPPLSPAGLLWLYRNSQYLRPNVEAMAHNVDGFGWHPVPAIDWDAEDIKQQVETLLLMQKLEESALTDNDGSSLPELPDPSVVDETIKAWQLRARVEKAVLQQHFESCCYEHSFTELRRRTTVDKESIGWGAWEVIEDEGGRPQRYKHVPAHTLRLTREHNPVETSVRVRTSKVTYTERRVMRRFRTIVQVSEGGGDPRHFKEYGDPWVTSSTSGARYETAAKMTAKEPKAVAANAILLFPIYFPGTSYGIVRHHGVLPQLKGAWLAGNNVVDYLQNSAIPRALLLVNDGKLNRRSVRDVQNYFGTQKGQAENRMAIIQAMTPKDRSFEGSSRVKMEFVSLRQAQREDATFTNYCDRVMHETGQVYRIPGILRGDTRDLNRATSDNAKRLAEEQVFEPERAAFDWIMNHRILPALGIRFWTFKSRGPSMQDPERLAEVAERLGKLGVVVPAELRGVAERALGIDLLRVAGDWQQLPIQLVMQGFKAPGQRPTAGEQGGEGGGEDSDEGAEEKGDQHALKAAMDVLQARQRLDDDLLAMVSAKYRESIAADAEALAALDNDDD